jgi:ribulose bisphosphate carboxylase small subunit
MHVDILGSYKQLNKAWRSFEHKGKRMSKSQVKKVLEYALKKGYKTTEELSDKEVDEILL